MKGIAKNIGTILIVEDYEDVRRMLRMLLESEHFRVLDAGSGAEALNLLNSEYPDIILMDLGLPGFDGIETIRRIRKRDGFQNTTIIVLTAASGRAIHETAFRAGTNYFMSKPIDFDGLAELLKQISTDRGRSKIPKYARSRAQRAVMRNTVSMPQTSSEARWTN